MDVTVGSLAAAQLRPNGLRDGPDEITGESFDLFLNISESMGPLQAMQAQSESRQDGHRSDDDFSDFANEKAKSKYQDDERSQYDRADSSGQTSSKADTPADDRGDLALLEARRPDGYRSETRKNTSEKPSESENLAKTDEPEKVVESHERSETHAGPKRTVSRIDDEGRTSRVPHIEANTVSDDVLMTSGIEQTPSVDGSMKSASLEASIKTTEQAHQNLSEIVQASRESDADAEAISADLADTGEGEAGDVYISDIADETDMSVLLDKATKTSTSAEKSQMDAQAIGDIEEVGQSDMPDFSDGGRFLDDSGSDETSQNLDAFDRADNEITFEMTPDSDAHESHDEWSRLLRGHRLDAGANESLRSLTSTTTKLGAAEIRQQPMDAGPRLAAGPAPTAPKTPTTAAMQAKAAQPPSPGRLPEGVDELSIFRQISDAMRLKNGRLQKADIRLNPEELGTVRVQMQMKDGAVRVLVNTESVAVGEIVSSGLEQLRKDMLAQGVQVEEFEVRSELTQDHGQQNRGGESNDGEQHDEPTKEGQTFRRRNHSGRISVEA